MKSLILFFATLFVLTSCGKSEAEIKLDTLQVKARSHMNDLPVLDFSNPSVFMGSDFGNFFQTLFKQGKFEDMIKFTSAKSIDKFGKDAILSFYRNELEFGYDLGNRPASVVTSGDTITLNFKANIMATTKIIRLNVFIENDSCKIVLPNKLTNFPG